MSRIDWADARDRVERSAAALAGMDATDAASQAQLLRQRAIALAAPARHDTHELADGGCAEVLVFEVAGERYAFETAWIARVTPMLPLTAIPGVPGHVAGIAACDGEVFAVLDLRLLLALPLSALAEPAAMLLLRGEGREFAVLAEAVAGVRSYPRAALGHCLPSLANLDASYLVGVAPDHTALLDGHRLLTDPTLVVHAGR